MTDRRRLLGAIAAAIDAGTRAVEEFGHGRQLVKAVEEAGELIVALARFREGRGDEADVRGEVADVLITALQVGRVIFGDDAALADAIEAKTARLLRRIEGDE